MSLLWQPTYVMLAHICMAGYKQANDGYTPFILAVLQKEKELMFSQNQIASHTIK